MFQFYGSDAPKPGDDAAEIERFRARHRRLCRGQQPDAPSAQVEDLDVDDGRTRKVSAKWRQQQQQLQVPVSNQFDDANWAADAEMHAGFNAFDFSASPEAFGEQQQQSNAPREDNQLEQDQDEGGAFKSTSLWERRFTGVRQPGGPSRQLPTLGKDALWGGPVHYVTHDAQRRALFYQPQYYA
ncbi:unnamed protein product [Phytophthora fragariaefolia]|uniref:Unnamed protein product n=1 Tax=Phytophthora fragariaefolia TaxID=1490495 RepID=A0A9W6TX71_9STRA|nr:unnamed protein product [Phytophthora fragariaefolia]